MTATERMEKWIDADRGWRKVGEIRAGLCAQFEVYLIFWNEADGKKQVSGQGSSIDVAIHAALDAAGAAK